MSNFTQAEIDVAVSQFIKSELSTEVDPLGVLNVESSFLESREFAAATLTFNPNSIFYLIYLASNRITQDVHSIISVLDDTEQAINEVGRDTVEVTTTSLLGDAAAALLEVDRLIDEKNAITNRPFSRYNTALDRFTALSLTPNIRKSTDAGFPNSHEIVRPPQQAQTVLKANIVTLRELHSGIIERVDQLSEALSEFLAVNLPLLSIQDSIRKVRSDLRSLQSEFDAATLDGAIEKTRDAFLRVFAGSSVITNLTSISDPRDSRMVGSSANAVRARAYASTVVPASVVSSVSAPYHIIPGTQDEITIAVNGVDQTATLTPDEPASITGFIQEPFDFHDQQAAQIRGSAAGPFTIATPDDVFQIFVDGVLYEVTLINGSRTATQIAAEVDAATRKDGLPGTFGSVATAVDDGGGRLQFTHGTMGVYNIVVGVQATLNVLLGFTDGQTTDDESDSQVSAGIEADNQIKLTVDDDTAVTATITAGLGRTAAQVAADITAASVLVDAADDGGAVKISSTSRGEGSHIRVEEAAANLILGTFEGQEDRSSFMSLTQVASELTDQISGVTVEPQTQTVQTGNNATAKSGPYRFELPIGTLDDFIDEEHRFVVRYGRNVGVYPITSVVFGLVGEVHVGRPIPVTTGDEAQTQAWEIRKDVLSIKSDSLLLDSSLEVKAANANAELGLVVGLVKGTTTGVRVSDSGTDLSFARADIVAGDTLSVSANQYTVAEVSSDGFQIEVEPPVSVDLIDSLFQIDSLSALSYADFAVVVSEWISLTASSKFSDDILELERRLNPVIVNRNPSDARINDASKAVLELRRLYSEEDPPVAEPLGLLQVLSAFHINKVERIDALLDMLLERGLNRAHDLLLFGQIENFFDLTKDTASFGGNFLDKMRAIAQNDVPVGTGEEEDHTDSRLTGSFDDFDADLDFSDQDDERAISETDDIPEPDDDESILNTAF